MIEISEKDFTKALRLPLRDHWKKAFTLFQNYGSGLSGIVYFVLVRAVDQAKENEVLEILEKYWEDDLQFQHPDVRGKIHNGFLQVNPTELMFAHICVDVLGLQPEQT